MREYAKIGPTFWTGKTGREIKRRGIEGVVVALYLMSSPHSNMLGLYYQPALYMAHETGLGIEGASKGLRDCIEAGFCEYDEDTETVWVPEMAAYQIGDSLASGDKRCKGIQKDYEALPNNPFLMAFFERYRAAFHLSRPHAFVAAKPEVPQAPSKGLSKPHRSQEQEQEQEQEQDIPPTSSGPPPVGVDCSAPLTAKDLVAEGIDAQVAADWLRVRKAKKAPLTRTAWEAVKREATTAGMTPPQAVKHAVEAGWQGFKAAWLQRDAAGRPQAADAFAGAL